MSILGYPTFRFRTPLWLFALLALLLIGACAQGETGRFFADPAQPIQTDVGQAFVIVLPSEQAGSFGWQLTQDLDPERLQLTASKQTSLHYVNTPDDERDQEFWIFMPIGTGDTAIHLVYIGPNGAVADERTFQVEIR